MSGVSSTDNHEWNPPSEAIQRLFRFDKDSVVDPVVVLSEKPADDVLFSDDEISKLPSTLAKAIRRTDGLLRQTESARKAAIETNNELKAIHTLMVRYARKHLKELEKSAQSSIEDVSAAAPKTKGFRRPCRISDVMCEFLSKPLGSTISRVEVNNAIHEYIKTHGLVDPENAQRILPDEKLWSIFSESAKGNTITYFSLQKYIKHHFLKPVK